jgi:hypothetical protein
VRGLEFQPDFVWIKNRSGVNNHILSDAVRGAGVGLASDATAAEFSIPTDFQAFLSNGFTVGFSGFNFTNGSGINYVAWNWNAGGSTATNTDGTITSQVRANTTAGFSIITYTGTGANNSFGHGLTTKPDLFIVKARTATADWWTFTDVITGSTSYLKLNTTNAAFSGTETWDDSVINVVAAAAINLSGVNYVSYAFHSVDGFSKFGSYTGNGSTDGPFVYTGFRPAFVMMKRTDSTSSWSMFDDKRNSYNEVNELLNADVADAEYVNVGGVDFLSNGFKQRNTNSNRNASGGTYIYMAFAENPFKTARAR